MAKTVTTKYGTVINVDGLDAAEVKRVLSMAQDNGAYGAKGAALAKTLQQKKAASAATRTPGTVTPPPPTVTPTPAPTNLGIAANGTIDPTKATKEVINTVNQDTSRNFEMNNPTTQTDALGNTQNIGFDPLTGKTSVTQSAGGALGGANTAFTTATNDFTANGQTGRQNATNAAFAYLSKNFASDKAKDLENAKQELAQRGIPIDPNPQSLWSQTMQGIDRKYQDLTDQANNQAITAGNQNYQTDTNAIGVLGGTLAGQAPKFTAFAGGNSNAGEATLNLLNTISAADLQKYGIDQDVFAKLKAIAASRSGGGGGGGSSSSNEPLILG